MRVLITGATGYLGSRLAVRLAGLGARVWALVRAGSDRSRLPSEATARVIPDDFAGLRDLLREAAPETAFHLAAESGAPDPEVGPGPLLSANVLLGANLFEALCQAGCRRSVNVGSYWEYASDGSYAPLTLYAAAKRALRDLLTYYALVRGLRAASLVLFDVYGPGDWRNKLIPGFLDALEAGASFPATPGDQDLNLTHVEDVVDGLLTAEERLRDAANPAHELFALDADQAHTPRQVAALLEKLSGKKLDAAWGARAYPPHQIMRPVAGLPRLPGWRPRRPLEDGLREALAARRGLR